MAASNPAISGRIFISYRRQETAYPAGWLFDRLVKHYGEGQVFKDLDSIELGDDFVDMVTQAVGACVVLLALIGDEWISISDAKGMRRLDSSDDFVRIEIEAALARKIRVIPILVDGATMPQVEQLPPSLARLVRRQALELSPSRFEFDTSRLLKVLDKALGVDTVAAPALPEEVPHSKRAAAVDGGATAGAAPRPTSAAARPAASGLRRGPTRRTLIAAVVAGIAVIAATALLVSRRPKPEALTTPPGTGTAATAGQPTTPTTANYVPQVATITVGRGSSGVAVGPEDVWVSNYDDGTVSRLEPASGRVLTTIPVGQAGGDIVACPDAVWVISNSSFVARIDSVSRKVTDTYQMGAKVNDLAVRCGDSVWASAADGTIRRIRQGARSSEKFVSASAEALSDIDIDAQGVLWTSDTSGDAVVRVDPTTKKIQRIAVGAAPVGVAATQPGVVLVTNSDANTVSRIDPTSDKVVKTIPVDKRPWGAAFGLGAVWVANLGADSVSRIDDTSGTVTTIRVGSTPDGIAVGHGAVWVANRGSGTVSRIT